MNRREAIAALTALPAVARISKADLKPTDVIVMECDGVVSSEQAERIEAYVQKVWPNHQVVVLGDGLKLKIVEKLSS